MGRNVDSNKVKKIVALRQKGATLSEIKKVVGLGYGTVFKYVQQVAILPEYKEIWKRKRGGSKNKSLVEWGKAEVKARELIPSLSKRDTLLILACLYWGEGNKTELSLINSDPALVKVFVTSLQNIGVKKEDLKITLRIYEDINKKKAILFWSQVLQVSGESISGINVLPGKKSGKLRYGMCRIRVKKGAQYFKLIMSMIALIKQDLHAAVVQWTEQDTPNV